MIGAKKHKNPIPSYVYVRCPACKRDRLTRLIQEDGTTEAVSDDTVEVRGEVRYHDACEFCLTKYQKSDERFISDEGEV